LLFSGAIDRHPGFGTPIRGLVESFGSDVSGRRQYDYVHALCLMEFSSQHSGDGRCLQNFHTPNIAYSMLDTLKQLGVTVIFKISTLWSLTVMHNKEGRGYYCTEDTCDVAEVLHLRRRSCTLPAQRTEDTCSRGDLDAGPALSGRIHKISNIAYTKPLKLLLVIVPCE
jgi:hypothetical protein